MTKIRLEVELKDGIDEEELLSFVQSCRHVESVDTEDSDMLEQIGHELYQLENKGNPCCPIRELRSDIEEHLDVDLGKIPWKPHPEMPWHSSIPEVVRIIEAPRANMPDIGIWVDKETDVEDVSAVVADVRGVRKVEEFA